MVLRWLPGLVRSLLRVEVKGNQREYASSTAWPGSSGLGRPTAGFKHRGIITVVWVMTGGTLVTPNSSASPRLLRSGSRPKGFHTRRSSVAIAASFDPSTKVLPSRRPPASEIDDGAGNFTGRAGGRHRWTSAPARLRRAVAGGSRTHFPEQQEQGRRAVVVKQAVRSRNTSTTSLPRYRRAVLGAPPTQRWTRRPSR